MHVPVKSVSHHVHDQAARIIPHHTAHHKTPCGIAETRIVDKQSSALSPLANVLVQWFHLKYLRKALLDSLVIWGDTRTAETSLTQVINGKGEYDSCVRPIEVLRRHGRSKGCSARSWSCVEACMHEHSFRGIPEQFNQILTTT